MGRNHTGNAHLPALIDARSSPDVHTHIQHLVLPAPNTVFGILHFSEFWTYQLSSVKCACMRTQQCQWSCLIDQTTAGLGSAEARQASRNDAADCSYPQKKVIERGFLHDLCPGLTLGASVKVRRFGKAGGAGWCWGGGWGRALDIIVLAKLPDLCGIVNSNLASHVVVEVSLCSKILFCTAALATDSNTHWAPGTCTTQRYDVALRRSNVYHCYCSHCRNVCNTCGWYI